MGRTRRRGVPRHDDPQRINRLREELGLYRLYLDDYFGYNAARALPTRGSVDPDGTTFDGLPGNRLKYRDLTADELGDNQVDGRVLKTTGDAETERAVSNAAMRTNAVDNRIIGSQALRFDHFTIRSVSHGPDNPTTNDRALPAAGADRVLVDNENIAEVAAGKVFGTLAGDNIPDLGPGKVPHLDKLNGKVKASNQIDWGSGAPPVPAGKVGAGYKWEKIDGHPKMSKYLTRADFNANGTLKR